VETAAALWERLGAGWEATPPLPDLGLPPPGDPAVVTVVGAVLAAIGALGLVTGWVDRRVSWAGLFSLALGAAMLAWVWEADRPAWDALTVPRAFVEMVARVLR
jgi:hypothetical protein